MKIQRTLAALALAPALAACDRQAPTDPQVTAPTSESSGMPPLARSVERPVAGPTGDAYPLPPSSAAGREPWPADAGKDSPATQPASTLSESEKKVKMPLAGHGNNHSSDSLKAGAAQ